MRKNVFLFMVLLALSAQSYAQQKVQGYSALIDAYRGYQIRDSLALDTVAFGDEARQAVASLHNNTLYFSGKDGTKKALVVFEKNPVSISDDGSLFVPDNTCHACAPLADIALFMWDGVKWKFSKWLVQNSDDFGQGWGAFEKMSIASYKGKKTLQTVFRELNKDRYNTETRITSWYDLENLKLISSVEKIQKAP